MSSAEWSHFGADCGGVNVRSAILESLLELKVKVLEGMEERSEQEDEKARVSRAGVTARLYPAIDVQCALGPAVSDGAWEPWYVAKAATATAALQPSRGRRCVRRQADRPAREASDMYLSSIWPRLRFLDEGEENCKLVSGVFVPHCATVAHKDLDLKL